ncbi:hypothetical protein Vadar_032240 [Vaccinium darrowii]|uniref:Uncharacterized protein n=1 Tax=Vaccinium darrowii TaxID=229202 RepID=A0ACB7XE56_9ERIC|nr:hypothetical protein Vadar_032240 [Vaccinium darrowii]
MQHFDKVEIIHKPRSDNRFPDALATLGAKVEFNEAKIAIEIVKKSEPSIADEVSKGQAVEEWQEKIMRQLATGQGDVPLAELAQFTMLGRKLYFRGPQGWLARCIGLEEAKAKLRQIHDATCGENDISLYQRVQRQGYYWPSMKTDAADMTKSCDGCTLTISGQECCFSEEQDWRQKYIDFLQEGALPVEKERGRQVKMSARRFFVKDGSLYRRAQDDVPLKCLSNEEAKDVLYKAHELEHQGGRKLYEHIIHLGYYWPWMEFDAKAHVRWCHACQKFGNLVHAPAVELHAIRAPYPFHTWAMDLVGPISLHSRKHQWILAATEVSTKWVEAVPLRNATGTTVAQFIKENIICRFGIPKVILSNNGTPFINKDVGALLQSCSIEHQTSTPYYPQGNGQAEATNKSLVRILSKLLDEKGGTWSDHLITALWAYRTAKRKATRTSPFNLVYGAETVLPVELSVPSARLTLSTEVTTAERRADLEALEERRELAAGFLGEGHPVSPVCSIEDPQRPPALQSYL